MNEVRICTMQSYQKTTWHFVTINESGRIHLSLEEAEKLIPELQNFIDKAKQQAGISSIEK